MGMGKKALVALSCLAMLAGLVIVLVPTWIDRAEHWAMFVDRLQYFVPGMVLMVGGVVGLTALDRK